MRNLTDQEKISEFMRAFGRVARSEARVYFTGGVTAVMMKWRDMTVDIDISMRPELDELFRALPELKEKLQINIELASPADFIPPLPAWEERSRHIRHEGKVDFYHYDPYSQALSKIERGHEQDMSDVRAMLRDGLIEPTKLVSLFAEIEPKLYRYPAIDPKSFADAVRRFIEDECR